MSALDRLKLIQSNFKQGWQGIQCESGGRPGTSNFVNKNRAITVIDSAVTEDERQKQLMKIFNKLRDLDDDRVNSGTSRNSQNSQSSFYNQSGKNTSEFLTFKNTAIEKGIQSQGGFNVGKNYHIENSELLVKFIRFENRMVRSLLENHQFT